MKASDFYTQAKSNGLSYEEAKAAANDWQQQNGTFEVEGVPPASGNPSTWENVKNFGSKIASGVGSATQAFSGAAQNIAAGAMAPFARLMQGGDSGKNLESLITNKPAAQEQTIMGADGLPQKITLDPQEANRELAQNAQEHPIESKTGNILGDILMTAPAVAGGGAAGAAAADAMGASGFLRALLMGAGQGAGSAAAHAAEKMAEGQGAEPGSALLETAGSAGLGGMGYGAGKLLEGVAPKLLEMLTRPSKAMQKSVNPPTEAAFKETLENGLVPYLGGFKGAADKLSGYLSDANAMRDGLMDASGTKVNITGAIAKARQSIMDDVANSGRGGVTNYDAQKAIAWLDDIAETAKANPNYKNGWLPAKDAMQFKTSAGKNSKFIEGVSPEGRPLANEKFYGSAKDQIETRMSQKPQAQDFADVNSEMGRLSPIEDAMRDRSFTQGLPWWEASGDIGGALAAVGGLASGHPAGMAGLALPLFSLIRREPGFAAAMYGGGKSLINPSLLRDVIAQAGRSGTEAP